MSREPAKITIVAVGSRGDVQPYVALARGLVHAGHRPLLATHEEFHALAEGWGVECARIAVNPKQLIEEDITQGWLNSGRNPLRFLSELAGVVGPHMRSILADCDAACAGAQLVLYSPLGFPAYHVADRDRIPCVAALWGPIARTSAFPSITAPPTPVPLGPLGNRISHAVMEQSQWRLFARVLNEWRVEEGLRPIGPLGLNHHLRREQHQVILGYSEAVLPRPRDWPADNLHITGYWVLPEPEDYRPPPALAEFLAAGPAPVYVGFGSMKPADPGALTRALLEALAATGQRAVLESSWSGIAEQAGELPATVCAVDGVPHSWLLPRLAAALHHGGAGTTGASLRAGLPTIVCPFFADQFFWAERVRALGAGPRPIPQKRLNAARLTEALREATGNQSIRSKAELLGQRLQAEDGVGRAVSVIERYLAPDRPLAPPSRV